MMKKYILGLVLSAAALVLSSCGEEEINTEFKVTSSALPLIPAKAVSCYSVKMTGAGETPSQDIEADYFRIPKLSFNRADPTNSLIISNIRITYSVPNTPGTPAAEGKCEIAGDELRALSSKWWARGVEAIINPGEGTIETPFETDCALYCGGISTTLSNFTSSGNIEIFGLERDKNGDETPVKLQGFITIQSF